MSRSPRTPIDRLGFESSDSFLEERSKTFVLPKRAESSADGASELDFSSAPDVETIVSLVHGRFDRKERQIKLEMRDEFERRLQRDSRHHEEVISALKRDISHLTRMSQDCENLKELQKAMQQEINDQHEKNMSLREENTQLKADAVKLKALNQENELLRTENEVLRREKNLMEVKAMKLKSTVAEKEQEIASLKFLIDTQYKRIKLDLTNTRDKFYNEQESLQKDMRQHHLMLTEISEAVKTLSTDKTKPKPSDDKSRAHGKESRSTVVKIKPFVTGKVHTAKPHNLTNTSKLSVDDLTTTQGTTSKKKN